MSTLFRPIDAILPRAARAYGGKVASLASLARSGFPVPRSYALSAQGARDHYARALPTALQPERLFGERVVGVEALDEARKRVLETPIADDVMEGIRQVLADLSAAGVSGVAVRSSSLAEDQETAAAAGLHESYLQICGVVAVSDAVRRCWASLFQARVLTYLQRLGGIEFHAMGVLLQATLPASVSGVMFTVNPLTGDESEAVIDAAYGLGTVVTEGVVMPDTYRIDKESGWVRDRVVGDKQFRDDPLPEGGVGRSEVPPALASRLCLPEHQLGQLLELARRVERHFGDPRDIEWAVTDDILYLLQARPVTRVGSKRSARGRKGRPASIDPVQIVWSNINVGEALPGVATPLTWSVLSAFSEVGFRSVFRGLGCRISKYERLVGNFRGRIYLNLTELSRIVSQVPGLRPSVVLPLGGGGEIERLEEGLPRGGHMGFLLRLPRTVTRLSLEHLRLQGRVEHFERSFEAELTRMQSFDLRVLPSAALDATLSDVHQLLNETGTLMLTAYGGLLASLLPLRKALDAAFGDDAEHLMQDLLSALTGVESADPGSALLHIAQVARQDGPARAVLLAESPPTKIEDIPDGPVREALRAFLKVYGHRAVREAEIAEPRWREAPGLLLATIRLHLADGGTGGAQDPAERARQRLQQAQDALRRLSMPARYSIRALLTVCRHYMRLRERLRARVTQVLGLFRWVALDAARRLAVREPECGPDATFFLHLSELHAVLRGEVSTVAPLVRRRKEQYARDQALPPPPATFVGYPRPVERVEPDADGGLRGIGASGGWAEGRVCVLQDPADASEVEPGDVLVVPAADVGFSPLFLTAAALVTESGGPLSHACVVAREYGMPAAVSVHGATRLLQTGQRVQVDGDSGVVRPL